MLSHHNYEGSFTVELLFSPPLYLQLANLRTVAWLMFGSHYSLIDALSCPEVAIRFGHVDRLTYK
jgi:hypothetical protein